MPSDSVSYDDAVLSLFHAGPGGICGDCGHFAYRHPANPATRACTWPDRDCGCAGMLWQGHRIRIADVLAVNG